MSFLWALYWRQAVSSRRPWHCLVAAHYGLTLAHPFHMESRHLAKFLLQASVVALGFGMDLHEVLKAGRSGFLYTALSIAFALLVGLSLGKLLSVFGNSSYLITIGTAICGGSAIAAIAPIVEADEEEMAVSLGTVFILYSAALLIFPPLGRLLHLSQAQFGLWAALAIHDTSSVVGAAARYGGEALIIGTTVKLARALWIVPFALATATVTRSKSKIHFPYFILLFCLAAVSNTYLPTLSHYFSIPVPTWTDRSDGNTLSDRDGHFALHSSQRWVATLGTRLTALASRGSDVALLHPQRCNWRVIRLFFYHHSLNESPR